LFLRKSTCPLANGKSVAPLLGLKPWHVGHCEYVATREVLCSLVSKRVCHRIADKRVLRYVKRFLKAGIMENGAVSASDKGTHQGGIVSPILANIYLHSVISGSVFAREASRKIVKLAI
jgi:hypothetical protein